MHYKILESFKGSPDGRHAVDYVAGDEVELSASLAEVALAEKWAEPVAEEGEAPPAKKSSRASKAVK